MTSPCPIPSDQLLPLVARLTSVWAFTLSVEDDGRLRPEWISDELALQLGHGVEELRARGWTALILPDDVAVMDEAVLAALDGQPAPCEIRVMSRRGAIRRVRCLLQREPDDRGRRRIAGVGRDVTSARETERGQALVLHVSRVLAESPSSDLAVVRLLEVVGEQFEARVAVFWRLDHATRRLRVLKTWAQPGVTASRFLELTQQLELEEGVGLPGRAWQSRRAFVVGDIAQEMNFPRAPSAVAIGLRGGFAFPIMNAQEFVGVLELFTDAPGEHEPVLAETMDEVGHRIGQYVRRKEIEEALRQSEALRKAVFDACPDILISADEAGRIIEVNEAAELILGHPRGGMIGDRIARFLAPPSREVFEDRLRSLQSGALADPDAPFEGTALSSTGDAVAVAITLKSVLGSPPHVAAYIRDLRETQRLQSAIRRRDEDLQDFLENGTVGLHWVREDATIEWANRAELELLGYEREEYLGRSIVDFHVDRDVIDEVLRRLLSGEPVVNHPARLKARDGSVRYVLINSSTYRRDGAFVRTRCFSVPVNEELYREALRALDSPPRPAP